jgi:hypothetical protein
MKVCQRIDQIHSHDPSHSHQHHIAQSGIAPSPNDPSLMHGGTESNHTERASVRVSKERESNQSIKFTHFISRICIHISSTFLEQISHHVQMSTGCQVGWRPTILQPLTFHTFNSLATIGIQESLEHKINPIQSINQTHSLYPLHAHQLHISQSDIAPRSNVHWKKQSGEAYNQSTQL